MLGVSLVTFLVVGLIAGFVANRLAERPGSLAQNLLTGVLGAFVGGVLFWLFGLRSTGFIGALVIATVGSVVLLYLLERFAKDRG